MENFVNLPNLRFYAPKAARSNREFTNLPFYGAFLGNNGIYHFTVLPFYGAPWQEMLERIINNFEKLYIFIHYFFDI